jgi:hypothetical protein
MVALLLLCAHLTVCLQPEGGRTVAPAGHRPPRHAEPAGPGTLVAGR